MKHCFALHRQLFCWAGTAQAALKTKRIYVPHAERVQIWPLFLLFLTYMFQLLFQRIAKLVQPRVVRQDLQQQCRESLRVVFHRESDDIHYRNNNSQRLNLAMTCTLVKMMRAFLICTNSVDSTQRMITCKQQRSRRHCRKSTCIIYTLHYISPELDRLPWSCDNATCNTDAGSSRSRVDPPSTARYSFRREPACF